MSYSAKSGQLGDQAHRGLRRGPGAVLRQPVREGDGRRVQNQHFQVRGHPRRAHPPDAAREEHAHPRERAAQEEVREHPEQPQDGQHRHHQRGGEPVRGREAALPGGQEVHCGAGLRPQGAVRDPLDQTAEGREDGRPDRHQGHRGQGL